MAKYKRYCYKQAFGQGPEKDLLKPMIQGAKENYQAIGNKEAIFKDTKFIADSGFYNKDNLQFIDQEQIDASIPDNKFRKRDHRFNAAKEHDKPLDKTKAPQQHARYFQPKDFKYDPKLNKMLCPAGKPLYIRNSNYQYKGSKAVAYPTG